MIGHVCLVVGHSLNYCYVWLLIEQLLKEHDYLCLAWFILKHIVLKELHSGRGRLWH